MELNQKKLANLKFRRNFPVQLISAIVAVFGVFLLADTLIDQISSHKTNHLSDLLIELPLLIGISIIYLSTLLRRRKRTAWLVTLLSLTFYLGISVSQYFTHNLDHLYSMEIFRTIIIPAVMIALLLYYQKEFFVRSDIQGFRFALAFAVGILFMTFLYGVAGFELLDKSDFHQKIGLTSAAHYTVDQFNITTSKPIQPYTKRAKLFVDSLTFVSIVSLTYVVISLFAPLRVRYSDQTLARERVKDLLQKYKPSSEEYFKVWPKDKQYYFDSTSEAVLAYHVYHGVALILSDPIGDNLRFKELLKSFLDQCLYNDWLPALVHVSDKYLDLYDSLGFSNQLLGQEALVDIDHFLTIVKNEKYFRNIVNKFNKQKYSFEVISPPHHEAISMRLKEISDEWLSGGGRDERGFVMGYYTNEYIGVCDIAIARDAAGTIQAFSNFLPSNFNKNEASYDLLRFTSNALGNVVDYLLINMMEHLKNNDYKYFNLGLSPLSGLDNDKEKDSIINNFLKFAYNSGGIFYSFSGLHRFKSKYRPEWQPTYVSYKGGVSGFSKSMTALTRLMTKVVNN